MKMQTVARVLVSGVVVLGLVFAGWLALLYFSQRSVLFPAPSGGNRRPRSPDVEAVWSDGPHGRIEAWLLPATSPAPGRHPAIIFTHGNGELIDDWVSEFDAPRSWGISVLLVEYPGYGRSQGRPSQRSITDATVAAYDLLARRPDIDPVRIVAYGRSVGGGAACALAARRPLAALVLESSFTSVSDMAATMGLPRFLVRDPFDNLSVVQSFRHPLLIIHGARDEIIPVSHGRALHRAAPQSEYFELPCGHNDCPRPWPELSRFLREHGIV